MKVRYDPETAGKVFSGPRANTLPPAQEQQYQVDMAFDPGIRQWKNEFTNAVGGPPNTETDPSFDYRKAWAAGDTPRTSADGSQHWGSSGKSSNHPTKWKAEFVDKFGKDPDTMHEDSFTDEMKNFISEKVPMPVLDYRRAFMAGIGEK
jgi:hypothetical protein